MQERDHAGRGFGISVKVMGRKILGLLAGIISAVIAISMLESFSSLVFPAPPEIDLTDEEVLKSFLERLPTSALYIVLFAHITCSFIGGAVVAAVTKGKALGAAILIGVLLTAAALLNLTQFSHPIWFWVVDLLCYIPLTILGYRAIKIRFDRQLSES